MKKKFGGHRRQAQKSKTRPFSFYSLNVNSRSSQKAAVYLVLVNQGGGGSVLKSTMFYTITVPENFGPKNSIYDVHYMAAKSICT